MRRSGKCGRAGSGQAIASDLPKSAPPPFQVGFAEVEPVPNLDQFVKYVLYGKPWIPFEVIIDLEDLPARIRQIGSHAGLELERTISSGCANAL